MTMRDKCSLGRAKLNRNLTQDSTLSPPSALDPRDKTFLLIVDGSRNAVVLLIRVVWRAILDEKWKLKDCCVLQKYAISICKGGSQAVRRPTGLYLTFPQSTST